MTKKQSKPIAKKEPKPVAFTEQQVKCMECRDCCEYVEFPVTMLSNEVLDYFLVRGESFYIEPASGVLYIRVFKPCQHLGPKGCEIYDTRTLWTCESYMCNHKDKSVKIDKQKLCDATMAHIRHVIDMHKKEKANDLQPNQHGPDAGVSDTS